MYLLQKKRKRQKKLKLGQFCKASFHCSYKKINDLSSYIYEIKNNRSEECVVLKNRENSVREDALMNMKYLKIKYLLYQIKKMNIAE